ncbi:MAG: carboxypeptidase regulatory-like domain-containing protein [Bryobacterales bacterium]|nr:carboxypeptidase regulatory-like domain-containing protein [Bryobacterales bacterium]
MPRSILTLLAIGTLCAQEFRSVISGRVADPQQSVVPGVSITAVQVETGARWETRSSDSGQYSMPFVPPGTYRITAESSGFKRYVREGVVVSANERIAINIVLEIGQVTENVTVTDDAPLLETATGSIGLVITQRQVENMPMNGRTPLMLAQLSASVIPIGGPSQNRPFDNGNTADFSVAGAPSRTNELLMDGAPNGTRNDRSAYSPPMDSVQELKVEAFQSDAAFGSTGGGTINLVTKSGTNQFHATVYHFNQVTKLAATPFFINRSGQAKPASLWNQYGVTSGGPVWIPRVFNGKDRLLYFFAFEGIKQPSVFPLAATVPTEAMRRGDLSQLLRVGANYQVYDPLTGVREGARVRRDPFPGNLIPTSRLNPIALKVVPYWPLPNLPGAPDGRNNFFTNAPGREDFYNFIGRMDFIASTRHKMFFNMRRSERFNNSQNFFQNIARGRNLIRPAYGAVLDDVFTFTPTTLLNTRFNWTQFIQIIRPFSTGLSLAELGFPQSVVAASPQQSLPRFDVGAYERLGENNANRTPYDSFQLFSSLTKILSKHSLKIGTDIRVYRESAYSAGSSSGRYQHNSNWTRGPLDSSPVAPIGQDFAAFLIGLPTSGNFDVNAYRSNQSKYMALFVQDDFRATANLTLNLGLRYEKEFAVTERFDRLVTGFDAAANTMVTAAARAAYARNPIPEVPVAQFNPAGGLLFATSSRRSPYSTRNTNFSPRFGFAWTPPFLGKGTVVRGGAGVFFFDLGLATDNQLGFSQTTPLVASQDGMLTPYATLSNPFPVGITQPTGSSQGVNTLLGNGVNFYNPTPRNPYSMRWNLNIQRLLSSNMVLEAGYVGNKAVGLGVDRPFNAIPVRFLSTSPSRDQATIDSLSANVPNPFAGLLPGTNLNGSVIGRQALLGAYPQFTGVNANALNEGSSWSHMMLVRLEKRFSQGLEMQSNFQYSRIMRKLTRLNDGDPALEKRIGEEDRPYRLVTSISYNLPFGKGKAFGTGLRGFANLAIGGWTISGFHTWQAGAPIEWGNVIYLGGDLNTTPRNIDRAFDITRFNRVSTQQLAQNFRVFPSAFSNIRSDKVNSVDFAIIKDFPILERLRLQYRCEFFNGFNRAQFSAPDSNPVNSTFGAVTNQENLPRRIQMALRLVW